MSLKELLRERVRRQASALSAKEAEALEEREYLRVLSAHGAAAHQEAAGIPRFYRRLPRDSEPLRQKLREETRSSALQRRSRQLLDNPELKRLWALLDAHQTCADEQSISYGDYRRVCARSGAKVRHYFGALVFAKLLRVHQVGGEQPGGERVPIMSLFNYIMRKVWLEQTRIGLSLYDAAGAGYLRECELEAYISELIPTLPQLAGLERSFHSFYVCTAARKFLFFLDALRAGRVRILDVLACSFLDDLLELRVAPPADDAPPMTAAGKAAQDANWFSARSALRVYGHYLNLDADHNGLLSAAELAGYGSGALTQPFLARVFQTCLTYGGEMDYKTYLDVVLALEHRGEPQALAYLFRILDVRAAGALDAHALHYFFRAIDAQLRAQAADPVRFDDFKDELFDMVQPRHPARITLADLLASGRGDTFVSVLIDFHAFWSYESREAISADHHHHHLLLDELP